MIVRMPSSSNVRLTREKDVAQFQQSSVSQQVLHRDSVGMCPDNNVDQYRPNSAGIFLDRTALRS